MHRFQPLLVTGFMRSGTSLLANFLNAQPDIILLRDRFISLFRDAADLPHPMDFLQPLEPEFKAKLIRSIDSNLETILSAKTFESEQQQQQIRQMFHIDLSAVDFNNYAELLQYLLSQSASRPVRYVGTKVTLCEHNAGKFIEQCQGKVIAIVRHPYQVISSLVSKNFYDGLYAEKALQNIKGWKRGIARVKQLQDNAEFHWLRYEDLIQSPEIELQRLSEFLQLPLQQNVTQLMDYGQPWRGNSSFEQSMNLFDSSSLKRPALISEEIKNFIDTECAEELHILGYSNQ